MPARPPTLPIVSTSAANAILSHIRPTTLTSTTLAHINALLDELLVSIVSAARSINLTDLRTRGASAVLTADGQPGEHAVLGALGRAAVDEAEVEIRHWYDGHGTSHNGVTGFPPNGRGRGLVAAKEEAGAPFPIVEAVELMRLKVGTFSKLAPQLPKAGVDTIVDDWAAKGGDTSEETIVPSGLWLTAVLEHVCEHILEKLAQVVARDSAATTASIEDLYTALCEDDNVYSFFKRMQIKNELENSARSATRSKQHKHRAPKPASSTGPSRGRSEDSAHGSQPSLLSLREESNSRHANASSSGTTRPSSEQFYKSVIGVAKAVPNVAAHKRASSVFATTSRGSEESSEVGSSSRWAFTTTADRAGGAGDDDFDAILRSNDTVRVSLTPSRFSTVETSPQKSQQHPRRHSDHLAAPVSSSESSLVSNSTQASTADSGRMSSRTAAGKSWSSGNKLQPRSGTIVERDEEDSGTTVRDILKSAPKRDYGPHGPGERTVQAMIVATPPPQVPMPEGLSTSAAPAGVSPSVETPPFDETRPSPRSEALITPHLEISDANASLPRRDSAPDDASSAKGSSSTHHKSARHRSEQLESQRDMRDLANFLSTTSPGTNRHVQEESSISQTSSTQSRMSFKGFMSRISSSKRHKDDDLSSPKSAWTEKRNLLVTPAVNARRSKSGSGSASSSTRPLRPQRSHSSVGTASTSTLQPQVSSSGASLSTPPSNTPGEPAPKPRELARKPSLVRKWAAQVTSGEPSRTNGRRRNTPSTGSSPHPTVSLDDDPADREPYESQAVSSKPSSALGFVPEPSIHDDANSESFHTTFEGDFSGDNDNGTPEAALAALTAGSRSTKSSGSPAVSRYEVDRERSPNERPVSSISARSSPRLGFGQLRHERVHELAEEAGVRSSARTNGNARLSGSSGVSTTARSVTESSPSVGTQSNSGSPLTATTALPTRTSSVHGASPRYEQRLLSRQDASSVNTDTDAVPVGSVLLSDLVPLRNLLDNATSVRECQLLLDAILSQVGVPHDGHIASPEDRVAAWLLAGMEGPSTHTKDRKARKKQLSPETVMKTLPALPGSKLAGHDEGGQDGGDGVVG